MPITIKNLNPKKTAVLVIDMENDFVKEGAPMYTPMGNKFVKPLSVFLDACRQQGMMIIYTTHVHRKSGVDMGAFGQLWEPIGSQTGLVDGTPGIEIYPDIAPKGDEIVIKKHRYSAFVGTDLELILRTCHIETLAITGVCTEICCFSTARDAMFNGYDVAFLSDLTGTLEYPDLGFGKIPAEEMHRITLMNIAMTTAQVMTSAEFLKIQRRA